MSINRLIHRARLALAATAASLALSFCRQGVRPARPRASLTPADLAGDFAVVQDGACFELVHGEPDRPASW